MSGDIFSSRVHLYSSRDTHTDGPATIPGVARLKTSSAHRCR